MTVEARDWFRGQEFRLKRLKGEGKDAGQARATTETILYEIEEGQADERIDKYFAERRRSGKTNSR